MITVAASYKNATPNADPTDDVVDGTVLTADLFRLTAVYLSDPQPGGPNPPELSARPGLGLTLLLCAAVLWMFALPRCVVLTYGLPASVLR